MKTQHWKYWNAIWKLPLFDLEISVENTENDFLKSNNFIFRVLECFVFRTINLQNPIFFISSSHSHFMPISLNQNRIVTQLNIFVIRHTSDRKSNFVEQYSFISFLRKPLFVLFFLLKNFSFPNWRRIRWRYSYKFWEEKCSCADDNSELINLANFSMDTILWVVIWNAILN